MTPLPSFDVLSAEIKALLAQAKQRPVEEIELDTPLEALGVDSLDKVSLAFDIEEKYAIAIPESALSTVRTVRDIVTGVEKQLAQHDRKTETQEECA